MSLCWYRRFAPKDPSSDGRYVQVFMKAEALIKIMRKSGCKDIVSLEDGEILCHELAAPIPMWLQDPLQREIAMASKKLPERTRDIEYHI